MQATNSDITHLQHEGDEDAVNFRPSPNFKHMRKYLKSKLEEINGSSCGHTSAEEEEETPETTMSDMNQPPLPPNPPPPGSPLKMNLKTEVEDDGYQTNEFPNNQSQTEEQANESGLNKSSKNDDKQKTMCRQFARGSCTRGASCIYAHELIVNQLPGIYTFCKNYQNSGCSFPNCKFVHATVFEKEFFYRTGYLPPHSKAHLKENFTGHPPPTLAAGGPAIVPHMFSSPPPPIVLPGMNVPPPGTVTVTAPEKLGLASPKTSASTSAASASTTAAQLKRDWPTKKESGVAARECAFGERAQKKCKNCDLNEFRLQCSKNKVDKLLRNTQEINKKISQVSKKKNILYTVVITLMRHSNAFKNESGMNLLNNLTTRDDDDKDILDKFKLFCSANNRVSLTTEDNSAKNISNVLMRMLMSSSEQSPGDA